MSYNLPKTVISPQANVSNVRPIYDGGEGEWSAALLLWDGDPALGVRWNGYSVPGSDKPHPGQPNSRGLSTWFILPDTLVTSALVTLKAKGLGGPSIDKDEATGWVDKELRDRQEDATFVAEDVLTRRVTQIVMDLKRAGQI